MQYKILIVDDDREMLKMLKSFFEIKRYSIFTAEDGMEAMKMLAVNPDIILLDVNMPQLDGMEVCRRIRDKVACPILLVLSKTS